MTTGQRFAAALVDLERTHDISAMVRLFSPSARLVLATTERVFVGHDGARDFWRCYLSMLVRIETRIEQTVESVDFATFQWSKVATLSCCAGRVAYRGVTMISVGAEGLIENLRTSYDAVEDRRANHHEMSEMSSLHR